MLPLWLLGVALFAGSGLRLLAASGRRLIATGMGDEQSRFAINGLLGTSDSLAVYVAGPALGGVLAATVSPAFVLLLDGVSFLVLLVVVLFAVPAKASEVVGSAADRHTGWTILRRVPVAAWLFVVVFFFNFFYMPVEVALPLLVRGPFDASAGTLGAIWTSFGIGALVGAVATQPEARQTNSHGGGDPEVAATAPASRAARRSRATGQHPPIPMTRPSPRGARQRPAQVLKASTWSRTSARTVPPSPERRSHAGTPAWSTSVSR